ncbi:unnamed protein product [Thelazia callipaeda]|uniref:Serine/threonine-protein kinase Chk2 n=1 Tax=Thelazia callipaeda TaxID=103827 RepID=A0A0N5CJ73_THECL|nr:unnamed protein product [Thelazia callipaeda]
MDTTVNPNSTLEGQSQEDIPLTQKSSQFSQSLRSIHIRSIVAQDWFSVQKEREVYAVLYPMAQGLHHIELSTPLFGFGRNPKLSEAYNFTSLSDHHLRSSISGRHCHIERDALGITYLHDTSRFGTFINEKLVGKDSPCRLLNGDLISLCDPKFYAFIYVETKVSNDEFPAELSNEYLVSNLVIGKGAMSKVYIGKKRTNTSIAVAIKVIPKKHEIVGSNEEKRSTSEAIKREVQIMLSVKHPNCVRLEQLYESDSMAYIVMEYIEGGELYKRIIANENKGNGLGEEVTKFYAWQIFSALDYLHKNGIVHRDIKPENVLLLTKDTFTVAKLTDFGLSCMKDHSLTTFCGTQCYMAPEVWTNESYDSKVDIWSFGAVIFSSLSGYPPFSESYEDLKLKDQIVRGRLIYYKVWKHISTTAREFVRLCLKVDVKNRLSAEQALSHEWFNDPIAEKAKRVVQSYAD